MVGFPKSIAHPRVRSRIARHSLRDRHLSGGGSRTPEQRAVARPDHEIESVRRTFVKEAGRLRRKPQIPRSRTHFPSTAGWRWIRPAARRRRTFWSLFEARAPRDDFKRRTSRTMFGRG